MSSQPSLFSVSSLKSDFASSLVVFLVALPLCMGIALASGAPLISGIISGIIGGIIVGIVSKSPLSVSGPAAGLTVIVLSAIQQLPTFEVFLAAVVLAGIFQIVMGILRFGVFGDFIPSAVIKGMLAAIGIILILKQIPHAFGYDADYEGDMSFFQADGETTFSTLIRMFDSISPGALIIACISLAFLFLWQPKPGRKGITSQIPGELVVVIFGIAMNQFFMHFQPSLAVGGEHLVAVPISGSLSGFFSQLSFPDFSTVFSAQVIMVAITIALVASVESLLCIEAVDKLDPKRRVTPTNRELIAQGVGNMSAGFLGGLPVTSVIVRSSANINAGAQSKLSAIFHGILLFLSVLLIPTYLNLIPLSSLAAILIYIGYKLANPDIFRSKWRKGMFHVIPFLTTILAILFTDLLLGVAIGLVVGFLFILLENYRTCVTLVNDGDDYMLQIRKDLFFLNKLELKNKLAKIPDNTNVLIDLRKVSFMDLDNVDIIADFLHTARERGITVTFKRDKKCENSSFYRELNYAAT